MECSPSFSALKVLALLDLIATRRGSVRPSELAAERGEGRATICQRMVTLAAAGWVEPLKRSATRLSAMLEGR